ncbi:MAG TPA: PEGA domain-containing protein [Polyangiaceae bacterium]
MTTRIALAAAAVVLLAPVLSRADESGSTRDAAKHFQRAVALYGEADYRAALVEFKRAYAIAPNTSVLYNVGETQYQLQDYAGALTSFERYLAESSASDAHRTEVENDVEILRARVGHLSVVTIPPGADVSVDDQAVGHTPIDKPVLVSVGHRKVTASMPGRPAVTRYVDVATDDNLSVTLQMPDMTGNGTAGSAKPYGDGTSAAHPPSADGGHTLQTLGWITTGGLAIGAIATGIVAAHESSTLQSDRNTYPQNSATLERDAHATTTYSVIADSLAAGAVLVGGITLVSMLGGGSSSTPKRGSAGEVQVVLGPTSAGITGSF